MIPLIGEMSEGQKGLGLSRTVAPYNLTSGVFMFSSKLSFIMAAVGAAVGLGNLFRFPALCVKYGSAFILVYIMLLVLVGLPLLFSEIALGRRFGGTASACFKTADKKAAPLGFLCSANAFIIMTYYCVLFCFVVLAAVFSYKLNGLTGRAAADIFGGIIFPEKFSPVLLCALIFAWAAVLFCFGGADRLGKISTASVIFSSSALLLLAIFSFFKAKGQIFSFFKLNFKVLLSPSFWGDSLGQIFFSLSLMVGVLVTYGAALSIKESIIKCGSLIAFFDLAVSLAGTVIYVSVGAEGADGLLSSFSVYPKAFSAFGALAAPALCLFYLSVGFLCLDSVFSYLKSAVGFFTHRLGGGELPWAVGLAAVSALLGAFMLQGSGLAFALILDGKIVPFLVLSVGLLECALFSRLRGNRSLLNEINKNAKRGLSARFYALSVGLFAPLILAVLLISYIFL